MIVSNKMGEPAEQKTLHSVSTKMTEDTKYMDVLNGVLLFGKEKFSDTAKPIRHGTIVTPEDMKREELALSSRTPYSQRENKGFRPLENSIWLVDGVKIPLSNGFTLEITSNGIDEIGDIRKLKEKEEADFIAKALNSVIKMANGQIEGYEFYRDGEKSTNDSLRGLEACGVQTEREFTINGTRFQVKGGLLQKTGKGTGK